MTRKAHPFTAKHIRRYAAYLQEQERASATIQKYVHDLSALLGWLDGAPVTKTALIAWKEALTADHAPATVNSMLAAVNGFLAFMGWREMRVKLLKLQKAIFCDPAKELTRAEYARLVRAAERRENQRLSLIIQTICATGIRVSELRFITVEAVQSGRAEVNNKGKRRTVFLPDKLRRLLQNYLRAQKNHRRGGVRHQDGAAHRPLQHLAGHETPVRERRGGAGEGVPPQSAPPVCADVLCAGKRPVPAGGHPGPLQREYHPHLHHRERGRPRPAGGAPGADYHIVFVLW